MFFKLFAEGDISISSGGPIRKIVLPDIARLFEKNM